ncbi:hypothetical protein [Brevibacillus fortis]|nr:hypothetical protein [Brevibacillus fortis]
MSFLFQAGIQFLSLSKPTLFLLNMLILYAELCNVDYLFIVQFTQLSI